MPDSNLMDWFELHKFTEGDSFINYCSTYKEFLAAHNFLRLKDASKDTFYFEGCEN